MLMPTKLYFIVFGLLTIAGGIMDCGGFFAIRNLADLAERAGELLARDSTDARRDRLICLQTITHNDTIG